MGRHSEEYFEQEQGHGRHSYEAQYGQPDPDTTETWRTDPHGPSSGYRNAWDRGPAEPDPFDAASDRPPRDELDDELDSVHPRARGGYRDPSHDDTEEIIMPGRRFEPAPPPPFSPDDFEDKEEVFGPSGREPLTEDDEEESEYRGIAGSYINPDMLRGRRGEDPNPIESSEEAPAKSRRVPWKFIIGAGALGLACCGVVGQRFSYDNPNGYRPGAQVETKGPNMIPSTATITGDPMSTAEQRRAAVQRAVNNGEFGKTVHTLPGELVATGPNGRKLTVRNPIIVPEGLPNPASFDLKNGVLGGRIFALTPGGYDATKGVGQSYNLIPIDPGKVTSWKGATKPSEIVDVELAWGKDNAGEGLEPKSDKPYMQNNQTGQVLKPGTPDNDTNDVYAVGHVS